MPELNDPRDRSGKKPPRIPPRPDFDAINAADDRRRRLTPQDYTTHPRYREWQRTQSPEEDVIAPPKPGGGSFESWLNASPRIRGENPPDFDLTHVHELQSAIRKATIGLWGFGSLLLLLPFQTIITRNTSIFFGVCIQAIIFIGLVMGVTMLFKRVKLMAELSDFLKIAPLDLSNDGYHPRHFELDAYNTDFTSPMADRSILLITVHFQIPRTLNVPVYSYSGATAPPPFVEQLNRVAEAKLIAYTQDFTKPPTRIAIEDMLNRELVRFQNENRVAVLRVEVPIVIPIKPDNPVTVRV